MLTAPSTADLAQYSGRGVDAYNDFAGQALGQATLLFQVVTGRTTFPDDPAEAQLARYAIMEMADRMYLEQGYALTAASPFQSETIGSYTYSKSTTARTALSGSATGLLWWDLAISKLSLAPQGYSLTASGSVGGGFDTDLGRDGAGRRGIVEPGGELDPPYVRIS